MPRSGSASRSRASRWSSVSALVACVSSMVTHRLRPGVDTRENLRGRLAAAEDVDMSEVVREAVRPPGDEELLVVAAQGVDELPAAARGGVEDVGLADHGEDREGHLLEDVPIVGLPVLAGEGA